MLKPLFHVNFKKMQILRVSQNINIQVSGRVFQILLRCVCVCVCGGGGGGVGGVNLRRSDFDHSNLFQS